MDLKTQAAHEAIKQARQAQQRGDKRAARRYAEEAVRLAPDIEEGWLMLAALASPRASIVYLQRALRINPASPRAQKGMQWAIARLQAQPAPAKPARPAIQVPLTPTPRYPRKPVPGAIASRRISTPLILLIVVCAGLGIAALSGVLSPALASFRGSAAPAPSEAQGLAGNPLDINQPTYTPTLTDTPTATPTFTPSPTATDTPTPTATWTPLATDTPLPPPPTMVVYDPTSVPTYSVPSYGGERWIDVDLTNQMVYAYEGSNMVNSFLVSTGTWQHPTVTGQYHIYIKLRYTEMIGPDYDLPNVPYTMYFYQGYGLHGTYWHSNFGTPMSHGCVNLSIPDAEWLYYWASVGTLVNVHY